MYVEDMQCCQNEGLLTDKSAAVVWLLCTHPVTLPEGCMSVSGPVNNTVTPIFNGPSVRALALRCAPRTKSPRTDRLAAAGLQLQVSHQHHLLLHRRRVWSIHLSAGLCMCCLIAGMVNRLLWQAHCELGHHCQR